MQMEMSTQCRSPVGFPDSISSPGSEASLSVIDFFWGKMSRIIVSHSRTRPVEESVNNHRDATPFCVLIPKRC